MEKPENPRKYINWWNKNFDPQINLSVRKLYEDVSTFVMHDFEYSDAFKTLIHQLHNYDADYARTCGYQLLMKEPEKIKLQSKEWTNFISKVWRKNVVKNANWDTQNWDKEKCKPNGDWLTPDNWYDKIHDIVRTRIVVKYFDGVKFLLDKMCNHFVDYGFTCYPDWEAREEGYYAAHLSIIRDYSLPVGIEVQKRKISIEIQVTTQIKDVISELTHKYYERKRETLEVPDMKWQWDYECNEFAPNYIGHVLHYIEGAVMQIIKKEQLNGKK
jgi:ppGpp synthetase/RelA/SpoT-type nucleotidyltranferase